MVTGIVAVGLTGAIVLFSDQIDAAFASLGLELPAVSAAATAGTPTANN